LFSREVIDAARLDVLPACPTSSITLLDARRRRRKKSNTHEARFLIRWDQHAVAQRGKGVFDKAKL
jgi:hypothetical protein